MGVSKKLVLKLNNKNLYPVIKAYSFYRKDLWGYLRYLRKYKYKRVMYNLLKRKKKFYHYMLTYVFGGIKFFSKRHNYVANMFFTKRRLKLWYGQLKDKFFGKIGQLSKNYRGSPIDSFFSFLERRLDVLLVRSLYVGKVKHSRFFVLNGNVLINDFVMKSPAYLVRKYDIVDMSMRPFNYFFFQRKRELFVDFFKKRLYNSTKIVKRATYVFSKIFRARYFRFLKKPRYEFFRKVNFFKKKDLLVKSKYHLNLIRFSILLLYYFASKRKRPYLRFPLSKFCLNLSFLQNKIYSLFRKKIVVFGLRNLKTRLFLFKRLLRQRLFLFNKNKVRAKRLSVSLDYVPKYINKFKRRWKISRKTYNYFKNIVKLSRQFLLVGFPPYIEVNYKVHSFVLVGPVKLPMLKYPFGSKPKMFFEFFKKKSYF